MSQVKRSSISDKKNPEINTQPRVLNEDLDYISSARAAVLQQNPRGAHSILIAIVCFSIVFVVWAYNAKVDEFTRGDGRVIPSQQVQIVQNLEGGILAELYVQAGQSVERGDALLRIDDTRFSSSLREADVTLSQFELKSARLRAEAEGKAFEPDSAGVWPKDMLGREKSLYVLRQEELQSQKDVFSQQMSQKRQELSELRARVARLSGSLTLMEREYDRTQDAASGGAVSEVELLRLERQVNDLRGEFQAATLAIPRIESSLKEAQEKLLNVSISFKTKAREELNEVTLELSRLTETSGALADRVQRATVLSPVSGTVKRILLNTIGGVIQPGMDIVEIVPSEEIMLVEARISPSDIAYLHPGQTANIRFSAYDFSILGGLEGSVVHISPDTIEDEQGNHFYLVRLEANGAFLSPSGVELPIISGMTVTVDILTGKKSVMSYLLKPIIKTKQLALSER